ncbi:MAG: polyprenyl diphosphate synthase [Kiritimatiellia bacterium]
MEHLAVIMDGNGRWAERRHLPRLMGHRAGAEALDRCMHSCKAAGIRYLTVYAFSTENWKRSQEEVAGLMKLLSTYIASKEKSLIAEGVRFRVIGRRADLSERLQGEIAALEEKTKNGDFTLIVALSYGGRDEIVRAALKFAERVGKLDQAAGTARPCDLERLFAGCLDAPDVPDPDLVIRTSGECRTSNFLLWESAYSEYYFTDVLWPDFDQAEFDKAMASFSRRERRMGGRLT